MSKVFIMSLPQSLGITNPKTDTYSATALLVLAVRFIYIKRSLLISPFLENHSATSVSHESGVVMTIEIRQNQHSTKQEPIKKALLQLFHDRLITVACSQKIIFTLAVTLQ